MSINICTANVNDENERRYNQTESTSFKHSHGTIFNHVKTPSYIRCNSKQSSVKKGLVDCYLSGIPNEQIKIDLIYIQINVFCKALLFGPYFHFCLAAILF